MHADEPKRLPDQSDRLIDGREVERITGVGRAKLYNLRGDPKQNFPKPVSLGARSVRFSRNAVLRWVAEKTGEAVQS